MHTTHKYLVSIPIFMPDLGDGKRKITSSSFKLVNRPTTGGIWETRNNLSIHSKKHSSEIDQTPT